MGIIHPDPIEDVLSEQPLCRQDPLDLVGALVDPGGRFRGSAGCSHCTELAIYRIDRSRIHLDSPTCRDLVGVNCPLPGPRNDFDIRPDRHDWAP